jgi:hypothetical protein
MEYLPFEHLIYKTNLSEQEVLARLSDFIDKKKIRIFRNNITKEYEGTIDGNSFEISRIIKGRNSFQPRISGEIRQNNYETKIEIKMRLHWSVFIFLLFWCVFVFFALIMIFTNAEKISAVSFMPLLMLLVAYLFTMFGFKIESKRSKKDLEKMLNAKMIKK